MAITKYEPAPPGARPGSKAGAPGSPIYNPIVPTAPSAVVPDPVDISGAVADAVAGLDLSGGIDWGAIGSIGSSGSGGAPRSYYDALGAARTSEAETAAAKLGLEATKYENQLATDAAALARKKAAAESQLAYLKGQLTGGEINPQLAQSLEDQRAQREAYVNSEYNRLLQNLGTQYGQAQGLTNEGFAALKTYLEGAPQNAFVGAPRAVAPTVSNDIAQYMASRGVEAERAQPGLLAARASLEGGASNYNNLLNVLAATSTQAQQSRLNEQAMAQRLAQATLTARKAAQEGTLTTAQLQGLQSIQDQYNAAKIQLQANAIARDQALQDAIAAVTGSGALEYTPTETSTSGSTTGGTTTTGTTAPTQSNAVATLAKQVAAAKGKNAPALQARAEKFIAANPTATPAQVKAEFPQLRAAAVKAAAAKKK